MESSVTHKGDGHRRRLRERFMTSGLVGFQDYEVIELLLTLTTPRKDCKTAAKESLKRFKTLQGVLEASPAELSTVVGIGPANQFSLRLIRAVAERYLENRLIDREVIRHSNDLMNYLNIAIRDKGVERFLAVFLDAKNKVIGTETLFTGTLTSSSVYPREVVQEGLRQNAAAMIFAHNHPSGDPSPSPEDIAVTRQLLFACRVMGIMVHEHLVIGTGGCYSFADNGYIAMFNREFEKNV